MWEKFYFEIEKSFQFEVNVGEWGKYIGHANTKISFRNYNVILKIRWLCYNLARYDNDVVTSVRAKGCSRSFNDK